MIFAPKRSNNISRAAAAHFSAAGAVGVPGMGEEDGEDPMPGVDLGPKGFWGESPVELAEAAGSAGAAEVSVAISDPKIRPAAKRRTKKC